MTTETMTDDQLLAALAEYENNPPKGWQVMVKMALEDELQERIDTAA